ncbi:phosphotransferase [Actinospica durhamensis]|uniref:Phosphotransferase n=1 Tax=Actinospica durhamensis TaxID=1508375 RepID=A0A941ETE1_9ACTN|nr:phosphotransferase [Actinospica durhamensis]MBR7836092.1 phosphotransferase [Actinospica durhamensis]
MNAADPSTEPTELTEPTVSVREAVASIPLFADEDELVIEAQSGVRSLNNSIWVVSTRGAKERYAVRLADARSAAGLGIDRTEEEAAARAAAAAGITPELLHYDTATGTMVTPWVEGACSPTGADLADPDTLRRLVALVRRMHQISALPGRPGAVFHRIRHLVGSARAAGAELPPGIEDALAHLDEAEAHSAQRTPVPGLNHNDLWENNILDTGARLYLVDWEFAGSGDGLYDLATISMAGGLDPRADAALLGEYGLSGPLAAADLESMKWVVRFFEAAWALVLHGLKGRSGSGFDYAGHARYMFGTLSDLPATDR